MIRVLHKTKADMMFLTCSKSDHNGSDVIAVASLHLLLDILP